MGGVGKRLRPSLQNVLWAGGILFRPSPVAEKIGHQTRHFRREQNGFREDIVMMVRSAL
jgi:hypothetical protein